MYVMAARVLGVVLASFTAAYGVVLASFTAAYGVVQAVLSQIKLSSCTM